VGLFSFLRKGRKETVRETGVSAREPSIDQVEKKKALEYFRYGFIYYIAKLITIYKRLPYLNEIDVNEIEIRDRTDYVRFIDEEEGENLSPEDIEKIHKRQEFPIPKTRYINVYYKVYIVNGREKIVPVLKLDKRHKNIKISFK